MEDFFANLRKTVTGTVDAVSKKTEKFREITQNLFAESEKCGILIGVDVNPYTEIKKISNIKYNATISQYPFNVYFNRQLITS